MSQGNNLKQPRNKETGRFESMDDLELGVNLDDLETELEDMDNPFCSTLATAKAVEIKGIHLGGYGTVFGGPYTLRPSGMKGIKLAPEVGGDSDYEMEVVDFGIPTIMQMDAAILHGLKYLKEDKAFYVGCMMGQGRTGTFLACFLKVFGYTGIAEAIEPIKTVRALYNPKAVETFAQEEFVRDYPVEKFEYLVRFLK